MANDVTLISLPQYLLVAAMLPCHELSSTQIPCSMISSDLEINGMNSEYKATEDTQAVGKNIVHRSAR